MNYSNRYRRWHFYSKEYWWFNYISFLNLLEWLIEYAQKYKQHIELVLNIKCSAGIEIQHPQVASQTLSNLICLQIFILLGGGAAQFTPFKAPRTMEDPPSEEELATPHQSVANDT
jgi:hypothetical protein